MKSFRVLKTPGLVCTLLAWFVTGCSSGPGHVSAKNFQRRYTASRTEAMGQYYYNGETNGYVYIARIHLPTFYYSKPKLKWQTLFTETNRLPPEFLQEVRSKR